jgi:hypothetical protein
MADEHSVMRWVFALVIVALAHVLPLTRIYLPAISLPPDEESVKIQFSESSEEDTNADVIEPKPLDAAVSKPVPPAPPMVALHMPKAVPPQSPPPPPSMPAVKAEVKPVPPKIEVKPAAPLLELPPLVEPATAYDTSAKTTEKAPPGAHLSDRNSDAADKSPKNLKEGEIYNDKGRSKNILFLGRWGEQNLPPIATDAASGSVKKSGSPDAGKGPQDDTRQPDLEQPHKAAAIPGKKEELNLGAAARTAPAGGTKDVVPAAPRPKDIPDARTEFVSPTPQSAPAEDDATGLKRERPKTQIAATVDAAPLPGNVPDATGNHNVAGQNDTPQQRAEKNPPATAAPKKFNELDEWDRILNEAGAKGKKDGRGGVQGGKAGVNTRAGEKGHEGNGALRPGDDDATSDVQTYNTLSSARKFDEARFAKRADPKAAYFKDLIRRIDGKWKAEVVSRNRTRLIAGQVVIKIVVRKDGKLLEATEVSRTKGLPDDYVRMTITATKAAADPLSDPFPPALQDKETIDDEFSFLYEY